MHVLCVWRRMGVRRLKAKMRLWMHGEVNTHKNPSEKPSRKQCHLLKPWQLEARQTRNGQGKYGNICNEIQDAVEPKGDLLVATVPAWDCQVPVVLDRLAYQHGDKDARYAKEGDGGDGDLRDHGEPRE